MTENSIEKRLAAMDLVLPNVPVSGENPCAIVNGLLYVSNQLCYGPDGAVADRFKGKVGGDVAQEDGRAATRLCFLNILSHAWREVGSLDAIQRCIQLNGFINATRSYTGFREVMDGASEIAGALLGAAGEHDRTTIGVEILPQNACASVGAIFVLNRDGAGR